MSEEPGHSYGEIVLAWTDDGHGHRKPHPVVIVTPNEEIELGQPYRVVCVSTKIESPIPAHHIELPWMRPRHPKTGLNQRNVAKCDWVILIFESDIIRDMGHVPPALLARIDEAFRRLEAEPDSTL